MKLEPQAIVSMVWKPKRLSAENKLQAQVLRDIRQTVEEMEAARQQFCELTDPDLVDAQIYWIKCLESRYAFLIRRAKACGVLGGQTVLEGIG